GRGPRSPGHGRAGRPAAVARRVAAARPGDGRQVAGAVGTARAGRLRAAGAAGVSHLLDTNSVIDHLRRGPASNVTARLVAAPPGSVYLCSVVLAELFYGAMHKCGTPGSQPGIDRHTPTTGRVTAFRPPTGRGARQA